MKKGLKLIARNIAITMYKILRILPISKKCVVFSSSDGRNYSGNPRAIYEYLVEQGLDNHFKCIWFVRRNADIQKIEKEIPGNRKLFYTEGIQYLYYMAISHAWVFDSRSPTWLDKKQNQKYIQTWHGTPLKKLGIDIENIKVFSGKEIDRDTFVDKYKKSVGNWDYLIAQNTFSKDIFKRCFVFDKTMLNIGYPRNDVLHNYDGKKIDEIKASLNIPHDKKVVLYAPTFRDDEYTGDPSNKTYLYTPKIDFERLVKSLGDEYIFVAKWHYFLSDKIDLGDFNGKVISFFNDIDINLLYLISDKLITDYSSVMFDYSILKRPMYFYCYDIDKYKNDIRGFYFDFENECPGPISLSNEQLADDLLKNDDEYWDIYGSKYSAFCEKYHEFEDGKSSKRICDLLLDICK